VTSFEQTAANFGRSLADQPMIRAVNFHNTPRSRREEYRAQLLQLGQQFAPVTEDDLDQFLATGRWPKAKPGVIVSVYEGYRNGFDVLLPLLEESGLIGWFFVITGFINAPAIEQAAFAASHEIDMLTHEYGNGRHALSWSELREIDRRHVVASHARTHVLLSRLDQANRESEIVGSQRDFEEQLGHPVRTFVSYGGPAYGEDRLTDRLIDQAEYQLVFSNMKIQRLRRWKGRPPGVLQK
jgi:peptidoglycan/xylan/chitin deacetylase (PgdA/CDA1 family)